MRGPTASRAQPGYSFSTDEWAAVFLNFGDDGLHGSCMPSVDVVSSSLATRHSPLATRHSPLATRTNVLAVAPELEPQHRSSGSVQERPAGAVILCHQRQFYPPPLLQQLRGSPIVQLAAVWLSYVAAAVLLEGRSFPPVCPWRLVTGHRCPFCGVTTSIGRLVKGRPREAQEAHPLGAVLFLGSGLWIARRLMTDAVRHSYRSTDRHTGLRLRSGIMTPMCWAAMRANAGVIAAHGCERARRR